MNPFSGEPKEGLKFLSTCFVDSFGATQGRKLINEKPVLRISTGGGYFGVKRNTKP